MVPKRRITNKNLNYLIFNFIQKKTTKMLYVYVIIINISQVLYRLNRQHSAVFYN